MSANRTIEKYIKEDLQQKMVFLAGPRQVGKTTLAQHILTSARNPQSHYYLWDNREDRQKIMQAKWPAEAESLVVLDELHKYKKWKGWLKGEFDKHRKRLHFLVTGSARMDIYRRGGDSLQGRYHHYRLHPFSLNEMAGRIPPIKLMKELSFQPGTHSENLLHLFKWSGFPEPILAESDRTHRRWQKERLERFFREDVRDLETIRDMSLLQILSDILPTKVGSPLSLNSLRENLEVSHRSVTRWMDIFERLYFLFRILPFSSRMVRSLKKEAKMYLWDWTLIMEKGARLENLVASHLLKFCHFLEDTEGYDAKLCYLRDVDGREVDFLVTLKNEPWFAVEVKTSDSNPSASLKYFGDRLRIPFLYQVVLDTKVDILNQNIRVMPVDKFLSGLV
jgi:predicted AAA+ superfamily ATPase